MPVNVMGKVTTLNFFAALPGRAATDDRLTALHFRVLMVIAGYDRMGRNGQCCWAGRKKLASRAGCHPNSLSAAISELVGMGYVAEERHESDGRKKGFRVVYDAEKDARGIGIERQENRSSPDYLSRKRRSVGDPSRREDRSATDYPSVEDRSPDDHLSDQLSEEKRNKIQRLIDEAHKPNILRRNVRYKSEDCKVPYGARTHETIVQALKPYNGWGILLSLPQATREYLEQRCTDGLLNEEDLLRARLEAGRVA